VVVEAAVRVVNPTATVGVLGALADLHRAVAALEAERADPDAPTEQEITWSQVVEGDEIYSPKTDRWYEVTRAVHPAGGKSKINAKGIPKPLQPDSAALVKVRRGPTGVAVDMFASVLWSS
jgi:hypothetical protein